MGGSIPYSIRRSVIKQWLEGLPRDQIAKVNQIATGTVSAIVKGCKEPDPEFILLREVAVILNQHRLDLALFSPLIRLGRLIGKMNTTEEEIEQFVENIDIHCFKKGEAIQEFIRTINEVSELSKKFGVSLAILPEYLIKRRAELAQLNAKLQAIKIQEQEALKRSNPFEFTSNVAVNPKTNEAYVYNIDADTVTVIDSKTVRILLFSRAP